MEVANLVITNSKSHFVTFHDGIKTCKSFSDKLKNVEVLNVGISYYFEKWTEKREKQTKMSKFGVYSSVPNKRSEPNKSSAVIIVSFSLKIAHLIKVVQ